MNIVREVSSGIVRALCQRRTRGLLFHLSAEGLSNSSTVVGLNTQVRLPTPVTQTIALFGEWKYNSGDFRPRGIWQALG